MEFLQLVTYIIQNINQYHENKRLTMKTPPLQLLPAFEATARHLSFKKAADELCVTASAISQQIKLLESHINSQLLVRTTRNVRLTDSGTRFYKLAQNMLNDYQKEFSRFARSLGSPSLRIGTSAFIAYDIIIPALHSITAGNSHFDLRIETSEGIVDFDEEQYSAAIRIGDGNWPGLNSRLLQPMSVTIAGSATFVASNPLSALKDLQKMPLIHARSQVNDWQAVADTLGIDLSHNKQLYFDSYLAAVGAAEQGLGLIVAMLPITQTRFKEKRLTPIVESSLVVEGRGFYFVQRNQKDPSPHIEEVYLWVKGLFEQL